MQEEKNGNYYHRFDRIERDISGIRDDLKDPLERLVVSIDGLKNTIHTLVGTHLKIIYWLLIIIGTIALGTKGIELYKIFQQVPQ